MNKKVEEMTMEEKDKALIAMGLIDVTQEADWVVLATCEECREEYEGEEYEEGDCSECEHCGGEYFMIETALEGTRCGRCDDYFDMWDDYFEFENEGNPYKDKHICEHCYEELVSMGMEEKF